MSATVEELRQILETENLLDNCTGTREAVARYCIAFRESSRFQEPVSFSKIGPLLEVDAKTVWSQRNRFQEFDLEDGDGGRPTMLSPEQTSAVVDYAIAHFHSMQPASCNQLVSFVRSEFHIDILPETLRKILLRDPRLRPTVGQTMEQQRAKISAEIVTENFENLQHVLNGIGSELVWNMDEISHMDWPDAHPETVYVPHDYMDSTIPIGVSRTGKRITLIACICADGSYAKSMVIVPRHTIDADLALFGVSDCNCHICHQQNGFIDRELFEWWLGQIFVPEIERRRVRTPYDGPALLLLDGCSADDGNFFLDLCLEHNIIPCSILPHSSDQVQLLDLCIFGVTRRLTTRLNKRDEGNI
jgi:hypothetical protein